MMRQIILNGLNKIAGEIPKILINPLKPLTILKAAGLVAKAVAHTERICIEAGPEGCELDGLDKKVVVVEWLNEQIDIPLIGETTEAKLLELLIDAVVDVFNSTFGRKFGVHIPETW